MKIPRQEQPIRKVQLTFEGEQNEDYHTSETLNLNESFTPNIPDTGKQVDSTRLGGNGEKEEQSYISPNGGMQNLTHRRKSLGGKPKALKPKKSIFIHDKVNYDKIMKSKLFQANLSFLAYLETKGMNNRGTVFVYNQERLPSQYFRRKPEVDKQLGISMPVNSGDLDRDEQDGDYSRFKLVPQKSDSPKVQSLKSLNGSF